MPTETPEHDGERQSDLAVMDANEYKQKRRLERILDAIDGVQDTADEAWGQYVTGEIDKDALNITTQRAVKKAVRECAVLLKAHARDKHENEEEYDYYWHGHHSDVIGVVEVPNSDNVIIVGLQDFLESDEFYSQTITEQLSRRNKPNETVSRTIEYTLPARVSYNAYLRLKDFLDDVHDMEISFEELDDKLPDTKPTTFDIPDEYDLSKIDSLDEFEGPIDARAVTNNDD